jgi:hypothetical protein
VAVELLQPVLPEPFPNIPAVWKDPITGLYVPKRLQENLEWRTKLLAQAEDDQGLQQDLIAACAASVLFWANAFVFTFKIKEVSETGESRQSEGVNCPYITWEIQDRHVREIENAIGTGYDLATDKSREMGASWNHILVIEHQFLFRPDSMFLELSRTEEYVDKSDNPKCLFWKHRYIRRWLPEWMVPAIDDVTMHFKNLANNSVIDGESANANAASGDRRRAVLLDEFAKVEQGTKIRWATSDVTACRLVNSTPAGPGTEYSKWVKSGQIKVFQMPWWEHPEKGKGRYVIQDQTTKGWRISSPWRDKEEERRSPQEIAQEIDMNHIGSGATFFDAMPIEQHRTMYVKPHILTRTILFDKNVPESLIPDIIMRGQHPRLTITPKGAWKFWVPLVEGRPDQNKTYIFGIDISKGQGASNSIVSALCVEDREKIAEFSDANTPPYELARIVAAAGVWFGGKKKLPLCIWEMNGPGWDFGRVFVKTMKYPIYYYDKATGTIVEKETKKYGWHSSREKKEQLLGILKAGYGRGTYINHCELALDEALTYVYYDDGGIGPAEFVKESESAKMCHGDRVIADALTLLAVEGVPLAKEVENRTGQNTIGFRRKMATSRRASKPRWGARFDLGSGTPEFSFNKRK